MQKIIVKTNARFPDKKLVFPLMQEYISHIKAKIIEIISNIITMTFLIILNFNFSLSENDYFGL